MESITSPNLDLEHRFMTLKEVAEYLGVDYITVTRLIARDVDPLPTYRFTTKTFRVKVTDLFEWIHRARVADPVAREKRMTELSMSKEDLAEAEELYRGILSEEDEKK